MIFRLAKTYKFQVDNNFSVRGMTVRHCPVGYNDLQELLVPSENQTCWICQETKLIPGECYEIAIYIENQRKVANERMKVLVCEDCICSIPELEDAEIISFGNGVSLPITKPADEIWASRSTPEHTWSWEDIFGRN